MAKKDYETDSEIICSYLRVGATLSEAFDAMKYDDKEREQFKKQFEPEIKQAQAQCKILCLHNIFTEGGQSGARFVLERAQEQAPATDEVSELEPDAFDLNLFS